MRRKVKRERVPVSFTLDSDFYEAIRGFSQRRRISFSDALHLILSEYFEWKNKQSLEQIFKFELGENQGLE